MNLNDDAPRGQLKRDATRPRRRKLTRQQRKAAAIARNGFRAMGPCPADIDLAQVRRIVGDIGFAKLEECLWDVPRDTLLRALHGACNVRHIEADVFRHIQVHRTLPAIDKRGRIVQ